jgi:hypothetical protein
MKERLLTGAGFWTIACIALIAAFGAVIALPYAASDSSRALADSPTISSTPIPAATHAARRHPTIDWEREYESAAAAMIQKSQRARAATAARPASPSTTAANPDEDPIDPIETARAALPFVGTDPDAEALWLDIINDPAIDPEARKDLIEDLNEEGFTDPDHLTPSDLPLIEARLALLEKLIPAPLDKTNAEAFAEARKDLLEMRAKLKPEPAALPEPPTHTEPPR